LAGLDTTTFEPRLSKQNLFAAVQSTLHPQVAKAMSAGIKTLSQLSTGTRHQQQHQQVQVAESRKIQKIRSNKALKRFIYEKQRS
jgi:hypothetical protein